MPILWPKSVRPVHWPQPIPRNWRYPPLVSLLVTADHINLYKPTVVVLRHVWRTFCRVHSKAACHFDPSTWCMWLYKMSMHVKTIEFDGKKCQKRFLFFSPQDRSCLKLHQTRSCTSYGWLYLYWVFVRTVRVLPALALQLVICRCVTQTVAVKHTLGFLNGRACTHWKVLELYFKYYRVGIGPCHMLVTEIIVQIFFCAVRTLFCVLAH